MGRQGKVEHVVVLMFENRSFDHIYGFFPHPGRLTGNESNPVDPADASLGTAGVSDRASYVSRTDPHHDVLSVDLQLFGGTPTTTDPAPMNGFIKSFTHAAGDDIEEGKRVMECFGAGRLPALTALAEEFCLCDRWFSSVPGPTWPNRFFVHAATSDGVAKNDVLHPFDMRTIFDSLAARGLSWGVYYHDFPHTLALRSTWRSPGAFRSYTDFAADIARGILPHYSFIEPRYFDFLGWRANDFHPPHDVRFGDYLVADVYQALRSSPYWEKSLLVVLFDEHGGYYDRASPPRSVPNPDGQRSIDPPCDFTRLGLRVPAVLVSPWVERGLVDSTVYEHSSVPATLSALFGLGTFLTERDRAANTFDRLLSRDSPRAGAPQRLPTARHPAGVPDQRELLRVHPDDAGAVSFDVTAGAPAAPLSEFQETLVQLAGLVATRNEPADFAVESAAPAFVATEQQAAAYVRERMSRFLR